MAERNVKAMGAFRTDVARSYRRNPNRYSTHGSIPPA